MTKRTALGLDPHDPGFKLWQIVDEILWRARQINDHDVSLKLLHALGLDERGEPVCRALRHARKYEKKLAKTTASD